MSATPGTVLLRYWPMKLLLAALAVTFAIAVVASVFAIWPVVADAPWEDDVPTPVAVEDGTDSIRCEAALGLRSSLVLAGRPLGEFFLRDYEADLANAESEINRYC